jgi:hypothetical protein
MRHEKHPIPGFRREATANRFRFYLLLLGASLVFVHGLDLNNTTLMGKSKFGCFSFLSVINMITP